MKRVPLWILIVATMIVTHIHPGEQAIAGVTGTLAGTVVDQKTGEPLPGANIIIKDTKIGTMADMKGFFLINNIPAGTYSVTASMMGYTSVTNEGVTILVDLRTTLEFRLAPTVLDLGEEVTVTAEAPMIQRDVTATTHFISKQEMEQLPVQSFQQVVDIQPGVAAGHIRGGRKAEVLYLVDGLPVQDAIEGEIGSELPYSSVIDMTVQTGGFNAEYGDAMSGVVNIITKEGGTNSAGRFELYTLNYGSEDNLFAPDGSNHDINYEFNAGGPLLSDRTKYFISANLRDPHTQWKREEFGTRMRVFNSSESRSYNIINKLTAHLRDNDRLTFQGLLSIWDWWEYDHKWKMNLDGIASRSKKSYRFSLDWTHTINPRKFFSLKLSVYNVLKSIYGTDPGDAKEDIDWVDSDDDSFVVAGEYPWKLDHNEIQSTIKFDWVNQMTNNHQIKAGGEFTYYDLYKWNNQWIYTDTPDPEFSLYIQYLTEYHYYPKKGAFYLQDKIEYEGMIANIGLRFDFLDPQASRPALEQRPSQEGSWDWVVKNDEMVEAEVKYQVSPRFGVNLPIAEGQELHVNYGYFFQTPLFDYLYTNVNYNPEEGFSPLAGNPDLKPAKTIMYEASYKHQLAKDMVLDVTIFSKDVTNLVDTKTYISGTSKQSGYTQYVNMAWVDIHGLEIYMKKRYGRLLSGKLSYTYMTAKGTGSSEREGYAWTLPGYEVQLREYYLSWDQRHTLIMDVDLRRPDNWGMNILWKWNSPLPYTHVEPHQTRVIPNNSRMHVTSELDVRFNKNFHAFGGNLFLFGEVLNLFDRPNILWVDGFGRAGGRLVDPGAWDLRRRFRVGAGFDF